MIVEQVNGNGDQLMALQRNFNRKDSINKSSEMIEVKIQRES